MENGRKELGITAADLAILALVASVGLAAIHWLVAHPEKARQIDMAILLGTQKTCLRISDGFYRGGAWLRKIGDNAGTQFASMVNNDIS